MNDLTENYVRSGSKLKKYFDLKCSITIMEFTFTTGPVWVHTSSGPFKICGQSH